MFVYSLFLIKPFPKNKNYNYFNNNFIILSIYLYMSNENDEKWINGIFNTHNLNVIKIFLNTETGQKVNNNNVKKYLKNIIVEYVIFWIKKM